jgi:hypothetical protein
VRFEQGVIRTPELLSDIEIPDSISVMGQALDLSQVKGVLQPVSQGLSGIISQVREGRGKDWDKLMRGLSLRSLAEGIR